MQHASSWASAMRDLANLGGCGPWVGRSDDLRTARALGLVRVLGTAVAGPGGGRRNVYELTRLGQLLLEGRATVAGDGQRTGGRQRIRVVATWLAALPQRVRMTPPQCPSCSGAHR